MTYSKIDTKRETISAKCAHKFANRKMVEVLALMPNMTADAKDSMQSIFFRWGFDIEFNAVPDQPRLYERR